MITQILLNFLARVIGAGIETIPDLPEDVQTAVDTVPSFMEAVGVWVGKLDPIVPVDALYTVLAMLLAAAGASIVISVVRQTLSYATGGGGQA